MRATPVEGVVDAVVDAVVDVGRGIRWYLREVTGESKWHDYVARCEDDGVTPISRREFERHRAEHRERNPQSRCC